MGLRPPDPMTPTKASNGAQGQSSFAHWRSPWRQPSDLLG